MLFAKRYMLLAAMCLVNTEYIAAQEQNAIHWSIAASLPATNGKTHPGVAGAFAGWIGQTLVVAGGANFPDAMPWEGGKKKYHNQGFLFEKKKNTLAFAGSFVMAAPKAYGASVNLSEGLVCIGGENENGISNEVFLLKKEPGSNQIKTQQLPSLPIALSNLSAVVFNHCIYVAGGETNGSVSDKLYILKLGSIDEGWHQAGSMPAPVSHAVMLVHENELYVIGGRRKQVTGISALLKSVWRYDAKNNQWQTAAPLPYELSAGTGISLGKNIVLFGGDKGNVFHQTEILIAAIAKEQDAVKRNMLNMEKIKLQTTHPGFSNKILRYNTYENKWYQAGVIPFSVPVTSCALLHDNRIWIVSGEIRAGVRTPDIREGKIINNSH